MIVTNEQYYVLKRFGGFQGRKRTSVNTVIKYTYSLHRCGDGCTAHVNSLMKNRPLWPNIHRLMQFLRSPTACGLEKRPGCKCCKKASNRNTACCRHVMARIFINIFFNYHYYCYFIPTLPPTSPHPPPNKKAKQKAKWPFT